MGESIDRLVALSGNPFAKKGAPDAPGGGDCSSMSPIKDKAGLKNALAHHKALKAHIKKHAKSMGAQDMLPEDLKDGGADDATENS